MGGREEGVGVHSGRVSSPGEGAIPPPERLAPRSLRLPHLRTPFTGHSMPTRPLLGIIACGPSGARSGKRKRQERRLQRRGAGGMLAFEKSAVLGSVCGRKDVVFY